MFTLGKALTSRFMTWSRRNIWLLTPGLLAASPRGTRTWPVSTRLNIFIKIVACNEKPAEQGIPNERSAMLAGVITGLTQRIDTSRRSVPDLCEVSVNTKKTS